MVRWGFESNWQVGTICLSLNRPLHWNHIFNENKSETQVSSLIYISNVDWWNDNGLILAGVYTQKSSKVACNLGFAGGHSGRWAGLLCMMWLVFTSLQHFKHYTVVYPPDRECVKLLHTQPCTHFYHIWHFGKEGIMWQSRKLDITIPCVCHMKRLANALFRQD